MKMAHVKNNTEEKQAPILDLGSVRQFKIWYQHAE